MKRLAMIGESRRRWCASFSVRPDNEWGGLKITLSVEYRCVRVRSWPPPLGIAPALTEKGAPWEIGAPNMSRRERERDADGGGRVRCGGADDEYLPRLPSIFQMRSSGESGNGSGAKSSEIVDELKVPLRTCAQISLSGRDRSLGSSRCQRWAHLFVAEVVQETNAPLNGSPFPSMTGPAQRSISNGI